MSILQLVTFTSASPYHNGGKLNAHIVHGMNFFYPFGLNIFRHNTFRVVLFLGGGVVISLIQTFGFGFKSRSVGCHQLQELNTTNNPEVIIRNNFLWFMSLFIPTSSLTLPVCLNNEDKKYCSRAIWVMTLLSIFFFFFSFLFSFSWPYFLKSGHSSVL